MSVFHHRQSFGLMPGARVLDVGCGDRPFRYATHLADLRLVKGFERRPFVRCRLEALPFSDKSFAFVFCSHVLEHVVDPARCCAELARVGERGYIECPRSWMEYVFSTDDHRWMVDYEHRTLIFREKLPSERGDLFGVRFEIFRWLKEPAFLLYWNLPAVSRARNVEVEWSGRISCAVIPSSRRNMRSRSVRRQPLDG
jgi:SAM-dependent methyltransferase